MKKVKGKSVLSIVCVGFAGLVIIYVVVTNPGCDQVRSIYAGKTHFSPPFIAVVVMPPTLKKW